MWALLHGARVHRRVRFKGLKTNMFYILFLFFQALLELAGLELMMVLIAVIVIGVGPHGRHIGLTLPQHASPHSDKDLAFRGRNGSVWGQSRTVEGRQD